MQINSVKFISPAFLLALLSILPHGLTYQPHENDSVSLTLINEFPSADHDIFIGYINSMSLDESNNIYITDWRSSTIHVFNAKGESTKSVHKPGRGPGEFFYPTFSIAQNNNLYINDTGNRRLVITDLDGIEVNTFLFDLHAPASFAIADDKLFILPDYGRIPSSEIPELSLVHVYDLSGNRIGEFGELPLFVDNMIPLAGRAIIKPSDDHLYILFTYYPLMQVYSMEGDLQSEYRFDKMGYEALIPGNYKSRSFSAQGANVRFLFKGLEVNDYGIFILHHHDPVKIVHFDKQFNYIQTFRSPSDIRIDYVFDMSVVNNQNEEGAENFRFYIANSLEDEYKVSVFEADSVKF
ncbi:MAG: 6-bladed beta-propeller [Balneolaceae bacterium]|nr:MAG: 6-bladed beta-propeller [Balneolaceae bacterium]